MYFFFYFFYFFEGSIPCLAYTISCTELAAAGRIVSILPLGNVRKRFDFPGETQVRPDVAVAVLHSTWNGPH